MGKVCEKPHMMPDLFLDVRTALTESFDLIACNLFTPTRQIHAVISAAGIENGRFAIVRKEGTNGIIEVNSGIRDVQPFSIEQRIEVDNVVDDIAAAIIPIPSDELDQDVMNFVLRQMHIQEQKTQYDRVEEVDDGGVEEAAQELERIRQERIRQLQQQRLAEEADQLRREQEYREEIVRKIEQQLEAKERYESQVAREQSARTAQVIKEVQKASLNSSKHKARRFAAEGVSARATAVDSAETPEEARIRRRALAEAEFDKRRVKMTEVAKRISTISSLIPNLKSIMYRQKGSHLVVDGASAAAGPATLVLPHRGDGTIACRNASDFFSRLIGIMMGTRHKA